ncbi:MAG: lipoyl domain-containing protein [Xanthobacteraceae bacterium]|nr:lipoyl domain-containing protein [Xanthobacteraceae bacterium]
MLPEGTIERWLVADGANVEVNDPVVELRIENSLVRLKSPRAGRLKIGAPGNSVVEPGTVVGSIR